MPLTITPPAVSALKQVTHDPTNQLQGNGLTSVGDNPFAEMTEEIIFGSVNSFLGMLKDVTGIDLTTWALFFEGLAGQLGLGSGTQLIAALANLPFTQQLVATLVSALNGVQSATGDIVSLAASILGVPFNLLQLFLGGQATQAAQINALQNNSGVNLSDDFSQVGLSGYTNLAGTTLTLRNNCLQSTVFAVGYRTISPATAKQGIHVSLGGLMQGRARIGINSDTAAASWAGLEIYCGTQGDSLRIISGGSPTLAVVQQAIDLTGTLRLVNGMGLDIWYDPIANAFNVIQNNVTIPNFSWTDAANTVLHSGSQLKLLVATNIDNNSTDGFYGPGFAKIVGYDKAA